MKGSFLYTQWSTGLKPLGVFHITGILLAILGAVLGSLYGSRVLSKKSDKARENFLWLTWIVFLFQEVSRTFFLFGAHGTYEWSKFPFQICGLVLFITPVYKLLKNRFAKDGILGFLSFYSLLGGAAYFVKPTAALYADFVYISCDSFLWHICLCFFCTAIIAGFDLFGERGWKILLRGLAVMAVAMVIAVACNTFFNSIAPELEIDFFYINQKNPAFYPVLNLIFKEPRPYPVYLIGFLIYFGLGGAIVYKISDLIHSFAKRKSA